MVAAPASCSSTNNADSKAGDVGVKSEPLDTEDPVLPFGSFEGNVTEDEHGDSTECSTSFGDSGFASDDDVESDAGIMEAESPLYSHINVGGTPAVSDIVRKKKVTTHWRNFIGPERWRCNWLELRMNDLLSQVAKYDKELALIDHEKYLRMEMIKADKSKSELLQLDLPSYETIKRKKRKRHEDTADTLVYIKEHRILSYYENPENKRSRTDNERIGGDNDLSVSDDFNNLGISGINFDTGDEDTKNSISSNDAVLEQCSLRKIILDVECIQTRITNLQSDMSESYNKIDCSQKYSGKKDSHCLHKKKNVVRPYSTTEPSEDEITLEMLFGSKRPLLGSHIEGICKESVDDVLIDNETAIEEEFWQFERIKKPTITCSEPNINVAEAPIAKLVKKRGPKARKKLGNRIKNLKKKNSEEDFPSTINTTLLPVDTRKSQRVRKAKIF
ncbi:hypothetical protein HU200_024759 [Digitaria exilis]|uniref:Uncharacterized protein n=1 Tax=Digitaria exilis TaxID=1010633 RepID=A0A835EY87_9POAL|nr:hypothetical protein HU200_024759 [Digitaria exilis]